MVHPHPIDPEQRRLSGNPEKSRQWKRWGPYLSDRQWGTVREDYSSHGQPWSYLPHDHARSRTYRWGEDGLFGITDYDCRLCFSFALWNEKDPILKERLFGLTAPEGNHGEDVKELYYYLDSTPTHSYMKGLYKYPQREFPYGHLVDENRKRSRFDPEFELLDTGVFNEDRYFDIFIEYAKASPNAILIRFTIHNRGPEKAPLHFLPTLWFRNSWSWGRTGEGYSTKPRISIEDLDCLRAEHPSLEPFLLRTLTVSSLHGPVPLFTDNETNRSKLFGEQNVSPYVKDAFNEYVVHNRTNAVDPGVTGTKAALHYRFVIDPGQSTTVRLTLSNAEEHSEYTGREFDAVFEKRRREADKFYEHIYPQRSLPSEQMVDRQAFAGLLWSKQFYHYSVREWLAGDPTQPLPESPRKNHRNTEWEHLYNRDIISMPDKWEYPWYAAWDLAFHAVAFSTIDAGFAKDQLLLLLREWYMHPNGQIPAYEFAFSDVNPPVHAWACWRVYKMTAPRGERDTNFLKRVFTKLLLNFTWWVNRKDIKGKNLFSGGFLGLDNIGVFDRNAPLPKGGHLEQADATAWMAFYCATMLSMALELAEEDEAYEDLASKFFEHFISITDAINHLGGTGLWDELDGFYYDQVQLDGNTIPLRARSLVGIIPLLAVEVLEDSVLDRLPGFTARLEWFVQHRPDLARHVLYRRGRSPSTPGNKQTNQDGLRLLAVPSRERLERVLRYVLDEDEFLSPYGVRSLSKVHGKHRYTVKLEGSEYGVDYAPGDSTMDFFGGNSNWRGPVWFPINFLLIEALERYHHFYGNSLKVEYPAKSGKKMNLLEISVDLAKRMHGLFLPDNNGRRPCHGEELRYSTDPHWKDLILFYEHFHGENGRGIGASHQTGWTALVTRCLEKVAKFRG